jgi:DNA replication and repair protein RecF
VYVEHVSLTDFRSYAAVELALQRGVTTFLGRNGQGKTNLVEAICLVATLGSHRVATTAPLVRAGAATAVIRTRIVRDDRPVLVELELVPGRAIRARLNRSPLPRAREVLGALRAVLFAPEDLAIVKGDPAERRAFLDDLLVARAPRYAAVRAQYDRVLRQRTALLKSAAGARRAGDLSTLDAWDLHLAGAGAELLAGRLELVDVLRPLVDKAYAAVSQERGPTGMEYRSSLPGEAVLTPNRPALAEVIQAELLRARPAELERGVSLVGPHRDELLLSVGGLPARGYASHGECWSLTLALRLAAHELLRSDGAGELVLVLDDVFAELDVDRRARLAELAAQAEQVLVTAAVPDDVPAVLRGASYTVDDTGLSRA